MLPTAATLKTCPQMSSSDSLDDQAVCGGPSLVVGGGRPLHRSLATYRYENALVKTELAATLERHGREVQEMRLKCDSKGAEAGPVAGGGAQLCVFGGVPGGEGSRLCPANPTCTTKYKVMSGLPHHTQGLEEDLAAAITRREKLHREKTKAEEDLEEARYSRQTSEQSLGAENQKLLREGEELRQECERGRARLREVTAALTSERHHHQLIKSRVSEVEQQCQVQLTLAEAQAAQLRQEKAEEEAAAAKRVNGRDQRPDRRRQRSTWGGERQAHLTSTHQLSRHNTDLLQEVKALEDKVRSLEGQREGRGRELREELQATMEKLQAAEKEAAIAGARVASLEDLERLLRQERESAAASRQELHRWQAEAQELKALNADLRQNLQKLADKVSEVQGQCEAAKGEAQREQSDRVRMAADLRAAHQEEAERLKGRIATQEAYLADKSAKYLEDSSLLRQKLHTYAKLNKKLRHKLECGALQVEQLEAQRAALEGNVPAQTHAHLQAQCQALHRKHNEFAAFLRGLSEFRSSLPEVAELTSCVGMLTQSSARWRRISNSAL
ncbi:hypothetical protein GWK47_030421 [Chionoecetes opilio]|uniref:Uncharacterized protein n=1 Tax=Chionoecetes opilio TaxID=41210 RepID=A0A8J4YRS0_CHIOP|nr:hypothetical protein GWK47_030421 [Chionoecetes opilio]